ncbi:hypothetical protein Tco_0056075, partial [Tanacetum coccineum]
MPRILQRFCHEACPGQLVNGWYCDRIDMVIKDLDLEPKIDAI